MKMITSRQLAFLGNLIAKVRKPRYLEIKTDLGFFGLTLPQLTCSQASRLIAALRKEVRR